MRERTTFDLSGIAKDNKTDVRQYQGLICCGKWLGAAYFFLLICTDNDT
jgi:hypothetical protein